ncbi:MAG: hypothetical protein SGJ27_12485 [Candidatus Melainabacteria bacterium]|nr:hypothetical protein [Candidatus Melainabacteria bacterium]
MNLSPETRETKIRAFLENGTSSGKAVVPLLLNCLNTLEEPISQSVDYLDSDACFTSMKIDPYWPKWNSPWWHMTLLYEMGLANRIPYKALELLQQALDGYLHFFPATEEEIPEGRDPIADILCQCALGTAHRILLANDVQIDQKHPWIREWFVRYQLADGGYNCDEAAYAKPNGKSSMISTIHIMESLLAHSHDLSESEIAALDRSAEYVLQRKLFRSLTTPDRIIDPDWAKLTFPRFYEIDILRSLQCILRWSLLRNKPLQFSAIEEVCDIVHSKYGSDLQLRIEREFFSSTDTRIRNADGSWQTKQPISVFPLLSLVGKIDQPSPFLTHSAANMWQDLEKLINLKLLEF